MPPHPLLLVARTSPAEPWICIPLSLPRTWGGIKGKVTRACLIKGLWTETKAGGGGGHAGEGPGPGKGGSWAPRPPFVPGAQARSAGSAALIRGSARGRARVRPCTGRHQGQPLHGRLLSACDHIWSGEEASRLFGFQLSAPAQTVPRKCLCR